MASRIPFDDRMLELEEVEGLVKSPAQGGKQPTKKSGEGNAASNRRVVFMLILGIMLGVLLTSHSASLRFWEGKGGENVDDVETKNLTTSLPTPNPTVAPTPSPTPPPPTQNPTIKPTVVPVIPPPSPPPTVAATPPPTVAVTPPPTVVVTPPPAVAAVAVTPPPKVAAVTPPPAVDGKAAVADKAKTGVADDDFGPARYPKLTNVVKPDPLLTPERSETLAKEWGKWEFVDKKADQRPKDDFPAAFPFRDVPRDKFPANAWQNDPEYLKDFLDQSLKLVDRSMEAILAEYGHGKKDQPDKSFDDRMDEMFKIRIFEPGEKPKGKGLIPEAGWSTASSMQGLVRRVLHSVMTSDNFNIVVGGHSAAAGHGNHFKQSYGMQFHKIMEPIFALLGVKLFSRNLAQGGLGTLQHSLGFQSIYGDSIDFMVWDSGMTEKDGASLDIFFRQALLSGDRVPFLLGAGAVAQLTDLNVKMDADISNYGGGSSGLPECVTEVQCDKLPWATRYMKCGSEAQSMCGLHKWRSNCWVERPDVTPLVAQAESPESQVGWHPGFRTHQLTGRILNMFVLKALKEGLTKWQKADKYALPDAEWHVSAHYENIRTKLMASKESPCFTQTSWPTRMCSVPMKAYTEFTPRANPEKTSITSIIKPGIDGFVPHIQTPMVYTGPDVHNPFTAVPEGEVDAHAIISNGRTFDEGKRRRLGSDEIITGLGFEFGNGAVPGYCDGSYNGECKRTGNCLLSGHHDTRGCLMMDSCSGWLVMTLPAVKEGIISAKLETWHFLTENLATKGWKTVNNMGRRNLRGVSDLQGNVTGVYRYTDGVFGQDQRMLRKPKPAVYCDAFKFEFAIDGNITSWDKDTFSEKSKNPQRVVEIQTLLDDPNFTKEPKDVEVAIRMSGCCGTPNAKTFCLSHMYFA